MKVEQIRETVEQRLPAKRWAHTQGVVDSAINLANRFGADESKAELTSKAELAALLHDVAKYWPVDQLVESVHEHQLDEELLRFDRQLLHAPVGAVVAEREYGITDREVLDAIRYHTSGRVGMTLLDKIVCLADYIEPGRDFPGVHEIRELAEYNINKALVAGFDSTIAFLLSKGKTIYPLTVMARNDLLEEME